MRPESRPSRRAAQELPGDHVAVGRNNWMIFGSPRGGKVAAALHSLMLTCRALDINPEAYLADALQEVSSTRSSKTASLTPWAQPEASLA